ncbi:T6SS effector BTH_I2691 family protein [Pseudomonas sp. NA-150]|uniref:T6SS effector BTH_I2691 family protein n=1 Tax=Pseudomonas sp. NA-150 TaxID=3367525 RepID=UPI0037C65E48
MTTCPFKDPEVAVVPMRYALDRSRYDVDPTQLRPLCAEGQWARLPKLKTRTYTLRQLRGGYVYVFDETANTLHEYSYSALDANLTRIVWSDADIGQDLRSTEGGEIRNYLLYPRNNQLHIAFSPQQWTWRVCEHLRSHSDSRALWMQPLNLKEYCRTMDVPHALQLMDLDKHIVADVDVWPINHDGRFADSAHPSVSEVGPSQHVVPLAAHVIWTGSVDDKFSSVMVALDDSLAVMEDLGMQLIADQAAFQEWQEAHEHKLSMAGVVEQLCGVGGDPELLPASVRGDDSKAREYLIDVEAYFEQLNVEEGAGQADIGILQGLHDLPSKGLAQKIKAKYGSEPSAALRETWENRSKWRREVDLKAARSFVEDQQEKSLLLRQQVHDTQSDLQTWAERIGTEPLKLFIDTTNPDTLLYLQTIVADLMEAMAQDTAASKWLAEQDQKATTLFGISRFGFSTQIKDALDKEANQLVNDHNDITSLIGRLAELNGFLSHEDIANKPWMLALSETARLTFKALGEMATGAGKQAGEKTLLALLAVDSRLAYSSSQSLGALLRNMLVGHFLMGHPERVELDPGFKKHYHQWKADLQALKNNYNRAMSAWFFRRKAYGAKELGRIAANVNEAIKQHLLRLPVLFDYQKSRHVRTIQEAIAKSVTRGLARIKWPELMTAWSAKHGSVAGAITYGVVLANLINTALVYRDLSRDGSLDAKDWVKIKSGMAYTGSALMALVVGTKWEAIKGLTTILEKKPVGITEKAAAFWSNADDHTKAWGKHLKGFSARMIALGAFTLIATTAEMWDIADDLNKTESSVDKVFLKIKRGAVFGFLAIAVIQILAGGLAPSGAPTIVMIAMGPWVAGAALATGLIYLFASYALNYLKRDAIGQWLRKGTWSRSREERHPDDISGHLEEQRAFLEIQLSPSLYVKPTYGTKLIYVHPNGHQKFPVLNGAWIQLYLPVELRGSLVEANLAASHRPLYVLPVEAIDQSLQEPFIKHGVIVEPGLLGHTPDHIKTDGPDDGRYDMPPEGKGVVWQTWVPLTENVQFIEMQVWYSPEILASSEGDRGYRFQFELDKEGVSDEKGTRLASLDPGTLQIETLGGREKSIAILVPN